LTRLPTDHADTNNWGSILNGYLAAGRNFNIKDYLAVGDGATDDTAAIAAAADAAYQAGGGVVVYKANENYKISRRVAGQQKLGGIWVRRGVSHLGNGATLTLADNCDFFTFRDPNTATVATITADVAIGATQFTVNSTTGLTAGDDVGVRLGDNAWDAGETAFFFFAKVLTIDSSTLITLDRPVPVAMTVSATAAGNRKITKLDEVVENVVISGFELINPMSGGGNAESGIWAQYSRNCEIADIVGENVGAGIVMYSYADSLKATNLRVRKCSKQGQASKGRVINGWNSYNCSFDGVYAENFENNFLFQESYDRGLTLRDIHIVNNNVDRIQASTALFQIAQSSEVRIENVVVEGKGGTSLVDEGATTGNVYTFDKLDLRTESALKGGFQVAAVTRTLRLSQPTALAGSYLEIKRFSKAFRLTASMSDVNIVLPSGIYRKVKVYVSSKTGLTNFYILNGSGSGLDAQASLSAGVLVDLSPSYGLIGTDYPFSSVMAKKTAIYTDGTVPAGTYGVIEIEYYPISGDDLSVAFVQDTSRLVRGLDVVATNALVAKTKAGVPADGDFLPPPPDGTIAIDTTNFQIYVRMGGAWKKTVALT
jgi:hypothetical protein